MVTQITNMIKLWKIPRRFLNLQEYQCNSILRKNLLVVQPLRVVTNSDCAIKAAKELKISNFVIKAQILAGGRGKGVFSTGFKGGVHITNDINEIPRIVSQMIGNRLITKQTPPEGVLVTKVAIGEALAIEKETYVAVFMDPGLGMPVLIGSPCGGIDIEEIAKKFPDKIFKEAIDIFSGPTRAQCLRMARNLEFPETFHDEVADQLKKLYDMAIKIDALQVEINPFILGKNNKIVCLDAKISLDDNAQFRQKDIFDLEDNTETPEVEYKAIKAGLAYIQMDGDIGCLVNGAGLAMATLDIVKLYGGSPSNFLDIGGTADEERVVAALTIFANDKRVGN
uniref:Succinate--CoA ligase [GDP-forming] subunit beta, mitochondrial (Trinotate prediction) n=1 Tax=Myxobolus squamalis TaxID=59785 RepID=A0A6B2FY57_MYXSQ